MNIGQIAKVKHIVRKRVIVTVIFMLSFFCNFSQTIWTVGPMIHFNIGGKQKQFSYSLEFAYWNFSHFPYSVDFAAEFAKKRIRLYSELQTGIGIAGLSAGPVFEIQTDKPACKLGFQGSVWGNYYLGFDLRFRYMDNTGFFCPGTYLKTGFDGRDEKGNKTSGGYSSSSSSHHHHHHHH
jgi:hypothetical protein